jgi:hypothetical protein
MRNQSIGQWRKYASQPTGADCLDLGFGQGAFPEGNLVDQIFEGLYKVLDDGKLVGIVARVNAHSSMVTLLTSPDFAIGASVPARQANGIVKTIAEHKLPISLSQLFKDAREAYRGSPAEAKFPPAVDYSNAVKHFLRERLEFYLRDANQHLRAGRQLRSGEIARSGCADPKGP